MSHKAVRQLIQSAAQQCSDVIKFYYADESDFNSSTVNQKDPICRLELLKYTMVRLNNSFICNYAPEITFYIQDDIDGNENETLKILDQVDVYVNEFIRLLNKISLTEDDKDIISSDSCVISSIKVQPFKKATASCLTGFMVFFDLEVPDDFNYCGIYG